VCVCVCGICACGCVCVCECVHMYVCLSSSMCICVYRYMCAWVRVCTCQFSAEAIDEPHAISFIPGLAGKVMRQQRWTNRWGLSGSRTSSLHFYWMRTRNMLQDTSFDITTAGHEFWYNHCHTTQPASLAVWQALGCQSSIKHTPLNSVLFQF
jgi:hypothetical protein